jgi:hypothetical protein
MELISDVVAGLCLLVVATGVDRLGWLLTNAVNGAVVVEFEFKL